MNRRALSLAALATLLAFPLPAEAPRSLKPEDLFSLGPRGELVVLESSVRQPEEISAVEAGSLRRLTRVNDKFLSNYGTDH